MKLNRESALSGDEWHVAAADWWFELLVIIDKNVKKTRQFAFVDSQGSTNYFFKLLCKQIGNGYFEWCGGISGVR